MPYFAWQRTAKGLMPVMIWMLTNSKMSDDIVKKYEVTDKQIKGKTLEELAKEFPPPELPSLKDKPEPSEHIKQRNDLASKISVVLVNALLEISEATVNDNLIILTDKEGTKWTLMVAKKKQQ